VFVLSQTAVVKRNVAVKADWSIGCPENVVSAPPARVLPPVSIPSRQKHHTAYAETTHRIRAKPARATTRCLVATSADIPP
jgi:hypothetical protein